MVVVKSILARANVHMQRAAATGVSSPSTTSPVKSTSVGGHPVVTQKPPPSSVVHTPVTVPPPPVTPKPSPSNPPTKTPSSSVTSPSTSPSSPQNGGGVPSTSTVFGGLGGPGISGVLPPFQIPTSDPQEQGGGVTVVSIQSGGEFNSHTKSITPHAMDAAGGQTNLPGLPGTLAGDSIPSPTDGLGGDSQLAPATSIVVESDDDGTTILSVTRTMVTQPSSTSGKHSGNAKQGGFPAWMVGVIVAAVAVLVVIIMGLVYYRRWRRRHIETGFQELHDQYAGGETVHSTVIVPRPGTDDGRPSSLYSDSHPSSLSMSFQQEPTRPTITITTTNNSIYNYPLNSPLPTSTSTSFSNSPSSFVSYGYSSGFNEKGALPTLWENPLEGNEEQDAPPQVQRRNSGILAPYQVAMREWALAMKRGLQRSLSKNSAESVETAPPSYRSQATS